MRAPSRTLAEVTGSGLREQKRVQTRQQIANTAARLFAEHGYEQVAISDVAREAGVAEQTVYNYFQTKEKLVTDRDQLIQDRLCYLIRTRQSGVTPAGAIRQFVLDSIDAIPRIPAEQWRGELGYLAAISPTVHRLALEMTDRQAAALAVAIGENAMMRPEIAQLQGMALASVFQIIINEAGRRTKDGRTQARIARELRPLVAHIIDELDRWLRTPADVLSYVDPSSSATTALGDLASATAQQRPID